MSLVEVIEVTKEFRSGEETIRPLDGVCLSIGQGDFVSLDKGQYLQGVKFGLRMAKEQTAPDVFFIPVKPPASAQ